MKLGNFASELLYGLANQADNCPDAFESERAVEVMGEFEKLKKYFVSKVEAEYESDLPIEDFIKYDYCHFEYEAMSREYSRGEILEACEEVFGFGWFTQMDIACWMETERENQK